jgi:hypothetical protein
MLQEILLSLSGHPSPLLQKSTEKSQLPGPNPDFPLVSPPERALLDSLANLSDLHRQIRSLASTISSTHPSTTCRAVAGTITSEHLGRFQQKILEVEQSILKKDASFVGGYGIVPLSTIVGEFTGWSRMLEWLWRTVQFMASKGDDENENNQVSFCAGPSLINYLRKEKVKTGYIDIGELAQDLIQAAEMAWMRQLSSWILYGKLPSFGAEDFFILERSQKIDGSAAASKDFYIEAEFLPEFVNSSSAYSILFIGKSLYHLRTTSLAAKSDERVSSSLETALLSAHLQYLSQITPPITPSALTRVIDSIRRSLSQNALSQLLSARKITQLLSVLQGFLLLDKGEFAVALINRADEQLDQRVKRPDYGRGTKKGQAPVDGISIKEGEVGTVLTRVLADLSSLQGEEDPVDEDLEMAQDLLRLSLGGPQISRTGRGQEGSDVSKEPDRISFDNFLFPLPTKLSIRIQPPLDLFLDVKDLHKYSSVNGYLLAIRRAHLHLSALWKQTFLRREHPAPLGPPLSNSKSGGDSLLHRRRRSNQRTIFMRKIWATTGAVLFLLSEIGGYLQGEVVKGHWNHFQRWLRERSSPSNSTSGSRPGTSSTTGDAPGFASLNSSIIQAPGALLPSKLAPRDPETLTEAHRSYLTALLESLLLNDTPFISALHVFLSHIDHFIALITRLQTVQQNLDLETDEGVVDALANYASEEQEIISSLLDAKKLLDDGVRGLVERLREVEQRRHGAGVDSRKLTFGEDEVYTPWKGPGVDRLLMKLDFGRLDGDAGGAVDVT